MNLARAGNVYFDARQPWKSRKDDIAGCATTINVCVQTLRTLAEIMAPFLPASAARCAQMLHLAASGGWAEATRELPAGHRLGEARILFRKIELDGGGDA
jgi:methionyl-tRNA synthetase